MFNLPAYVFGSSPKVAPVEAKESADDIARRFANEMLANIRRSGIERMRDEPKPSPSTPEPVCVHQWKHREFNFCKFCGAPKPQPDSSSISTEPMPEQFVGDEWIDRVLAEMPGEWNTAQAARELQQWRKWAAAKGSTEVEGK
jgi:hypothetical protein